MNNNNIINECSFREITIRELIAFIFLISIISIIPFIFLNDISMASICFEIFLTIILLWYFKFNKTNTALLFKDFKNKLNIKEICFLLFFTLFFTISSFILIPSLMALFDPNMATELLNDKNEVVNLTNNPFILFMIMCICAPILEELIFRAVIFKRLSIHTNVFWGALLSSIFFASKHPAPSRLGAFMFGIVTCLLYLKYKNILFPMLLHCLSNIISFSDIPIPYIDDVLNFSNTNFNYISSTSLSICIIASITLTTILLILFFMFYKKNKDIFATSTFKHE